MASRHGNGSTALQLAICMLPAIYANAAPAFVSVERSYTLTRESVSLPSNSIATYEYHLEAETELIFSLQTAQWRREPLRVWLLDAPNHVLMLQGQEFEYVRSGSGLVDREGQIRFAVPRSGNYFFLLDNSRSGVARNLDVYTYVRTAAASAADERARLRYQGYYDQLRQLVDIDDIEIHVRRCGRATAFTTGSLVVICRELHDLLSTTGTPGVQLFVLLHEISHSLIDRWGFRSIYLNQQMVDRLAVTLFAMMREDELAENAARWFRDRSVQSRQPLPSEAFELTRSRARKIATWLSDKRDLGRGWTRRIVVPRMSTSALEVLVDVDDLHTRTRQRIRRELAERRSAGALRAVSTQSQL